MPYTKFTKTMLQTKNKDLLIRIIEDLYREIDDILKAIEFIEQDIELIKKGNAWGVHHTSDQGALR